MLPACLRCGSDGPGTRKASLGRQGASRVCAATAYVESAIHMERVGDWQESADARVCCDGSQVFELMFIVDSVGAPIN
eukprot:11182593-Lingulodinium_polyedra.AAC.1